jgi:hypothetical protein
MNSLKRIALLDANVIYPAPLRDYLLRLALKKLYEPKWTDEILNEWMENLKKNRLDLTVENLTRTKILMNKHFPDANVTGYQNRIDALMLPDLNDRHVLAAGIEAGATFIVTNNLRDFPKSKLEEHNIAAISPDDFAVLLIETDMQSVLEALDKQLESLNNPPGTKEQLLNTLEKCGLKKSVRLLR